MNQKIETKLGVVIILIIAVTVGAFLWRWEEKQDWKTDEKVSVTLPDKTKNKIEQEQQSQDGKKNNETDNQKVENVAEEITSDKNKWKIFQSKENSIELKYPPELYLSTVRNDIILSLSRLSPEESKKNPDAGVMSQLVAYLKNESVDNIIKGVKLNNPGDFTQKQITVNGIGATQITYRGAYAGELWVETLIKKDSNNTIIIDYPGDSQSNKNIFEMIISTFKMM